MYVLICNSECEANDVTYFNGVFSTPDKAKEAIANLYKDYADAVSYEPTDSGGFRFIINIHKGMMSGYELILPEMDKYVG